MDLRVGFCSIIILKTLEALGSMTSCNNHENFLLSICDIGARLSLNKSTQTLWLFFIHFFFFNWMTDKFINLFIHKRSCFALLYILFSLKGRGLLWCIKEDETFCWTFTPSRLLILLIRVSCKLFSREIDTQWNGILWWVPIMRRCL